MRTKQLTHPAHILYNTGIALYTLGVRIAALWNSKARKMVCGWNEAWQCKRPEGKVAWFHASSLGEYEQARPVIKRFREAYPDHSVWVTFFSPSGYEVRKATPEADHVTYLPMDTPRNARRLVQLINPSVAFFVKYDFWFNTLRQLRQREVPTFIFSAIFRESQYFFKPYGGWFARQLGCFTHIFVQNDVSLRLLHSRGLQCCTLAGDTRFDRVSEIALSTDGDPTVEQFLATPADESAKCLIAGSSWEADEQNLRAYLDHCPVGLKLILAPHVISESHIAAIEELFGSENCVRHSALVSAGNHPDTKASVRPNILIIDNIGLLSRLYRYGDVAYIGGGFGRGIHNILEAVTYGKPVVFGPNHRKFQEANDIIALGGGFAYTKPHELDAILDRLLTDITARSKAATVCRDYMQRNLGSTNLIMATVKKHLAP